MDKNRRLCSKRDVFSSQGYFQPRVYFILHLKFDFFGSINDTLKYYILLPKKLLSVLLFSHFPSFLHSYHDTLRNMVPNFQPKI